MSITVELEKRVIQLSGLEQSLATGAYTREPLRLEFLRRIAPQSQYAAAGSMVVHEAILSLMVMKFSEQLTFRPLSEIRHWFAYSQGVYLEPGYPPLFYSRDRNKTVSPNKSAVAGIGEGTAGLLAQRLYQARKLARPNHDFPDIVMESNGVIYLVEAKATLLSPNDVLDVVEDELPRIAAFTSSCAQMDHRPMVGLLIGTSIASETLYYSFVTEVRV